MASFSPQRQLEPTPILGGFETRQVGWERSADRLILNQFHHLLLGGYFCTRFLKIAKSYRNAQIISHGSYPNVATIRNSHFSDILIKSLFGDVPNSSTHSIFNNMYKYRNTNLHLPSAGVGLSHGQNRSDPSPESFDPRSYHPYHYNFPFSKTSQLSYSETKAHKNQATEWEDSPRKKPTVWAVCHSSHG